MTNGDFTQVTKYLDITPSSKSDDSTLKQNQGIVASRRIKKIRKYFTMPQITGPNVRGGMVGQVNYSLTEDFYLTDFIPGFVLSDLLNAVILTIRYRVDTTVYRYRINYLSDTASQTLINSSTGVQAPFYTNELIKKEFVLECWGITPNATFDIGPVDFITSRAVNPSNADELSSSYDAGTFYDREDLGITFPEPIPTTYPDIAPWNSN